MPVGFRVASAWVEIKADDKGLKEQVKKAVQEAVKGQDLKVPLHIDSKGLRKEVTDALKEATKGDKPTVAIGIDSKGLRKEVTDALKAATSGTKPKVSLGIATTGLRAEVQRALTAATNGKKPTVQLGISSVGLRGEVQRALTAATAGQRATVHINADVDTGAVQRALTGINAPTIRPNVDAAFTREKLNAAIRGLNLNTDVTVNPDIDGALFKAKINAEVEALKGRFTVAVTPDVNATLFAAKIQAAARTIPGDIDIELNPVVSALKARTELAAKMNGLHINTTVQVNPDIDGLLLRAKIQAEMDALRGRVGLYVEPNVNQTVFAAKLQAAARLVHSSIDIDLNTNSLPSQLARADAMLNAMPHNLTFRTRVDVDDAQARAAFTRLNAMADDSGGHMSRLTRLILAGIVLIPPAIASSLTALESVGPAAAVAIPSVALLATVFGAVAVGGNGVLNAIEASTKGAKQFDQAMGALTPTAQNFVKAIITSKGAFHELQQSVQNVLFDGLDKSFRSMAQVAIPDLRIGLGGMALDLNTMAKSTMGMITSLSQTGTLKAMFGGLQLAFAPLIPMPGQFLNMFTKMTIAASPLLINLTTAWGRGMTDLNNKINTGFETGRLQASINTAAAAFKKFFVSIGNNPEWTQFLETMQRTGPTVAKTIADITEALMKLLNNLGPVSGALLQIADVFAKIVITLPPSVITGIIGLYTALKILGLTIAALKGGVAIIGGLQAAMLLLSSQAVRMQAIAPALRAIGMSYVGIGRAATALGTLARAGVLVAGLYLTFTGIDKIMTKLFNDGPANVDKLTSSLTKFSQTGQLSGEAARVFQASWADSVDGVDKKFGGFTEALKGVTAASNWDKMFNGFQKAFDWLDPGQTNLEKFHDTLDSTDKALASMVSKGHGDVAAKTFTMLSEEAKKSGMSMSQLSSQMPKYNKAVKDAAAAQKAAADTMGVFGAQALATSSHLDQLKKDTDGLTKSLFALNDTNRDAEAAVGDYEAASDALAAAAKKGSVNLSFQNGILSQNTALQRNAADQLEDVAAKAQAAGTKVYESGGDWQQAQKYWADGRAELVAAGKRFGLNTTEAEEYATSILHIPKESELKLEIAGQAQQQIKDVTAAFVAMPKSKSITVTALNAPAIASLRSLGLQVTQLPDGQFKVTADDKGAKAELSALQNYKVSDKTVHIGAENIAFDLVFSETQVKKLSSKTSHFAANSAAFNQVFGTTQARTLAPKTSLFKANPGAFNTAFGNVQAKKLAPKTANLYAKNLTAAGVNAALSTIARVQSKTVNINAIFSKSGDTSVGFGKAHGGIIGRFANGGSPWTGGVLQGPGTTTSDSIMAALSRGEFVMRASAVQKYGPNFMKLLNAGLLPGFAAGGQPGAGAAPAVGGVRAPGGVPGALGVSATPTSGTFTVTDATGKPVASAMANFQKLQAGVTQTYTQMSSATNVFGQSLTVGLNAIGLNTQKSWQTWSSGMGTRTAATYTGIKSQTDTFGSQTVTRTNQTSTTAQAAWNNWKTGMQNSTKSAYTNITGQTGTFGTQLKGNLNTTNTATNATWTSWKSGLTSKTNSTYTGIKNATSSFGSQTQSKFKSIVAGTGTAWGNLSPKFKPPVSYLVHTVINKGIVGSMNAIMSKLGGGKSVGGISVSGFAEGGHIKGPGTATSDSIPARLSNGEFVMQAKAVNKFGTGFMSMVNQGKMPHDGAGFSGFATGGSVGGHNVNISMAPGFAAGGAVGVPSADVLNKMMGDGTAADAKKMTDWIIDTYVTPLINSGSGGSAMKAVMSQGVNHIRTNLQKFVSDNFGGAGSAAAGLRWAKTQYGKPYQWGGNGNPSWDCSGFMSAIESVIRGEKPHRRWATGSFSGATAPSGWKLNANAPFKIGVTNAGVGHTAGTIGKENVESSGGIGVHGGASARGWNNALFGSHYGYVGPNATKKAGGGFISGPGSGTSDSIPAYLSDGEFVVRAAAVKRLGTGFLNSINGGGIAGFAKGGMAQHYVTGGLVAPSSVQSPEALAALQGLVTVSALTDKAIALGHRIDNETMTALRAQDNLADMLSGLQNTKNAIMAAFQGPAEVGMMAKFDTTSTKLISLQDNLDKTNASLTTAQASLDDLKGKFDSLKSSVSDNIVSYGSVTKVGTYGTSTQTLITQMQADVAKSSEFAKDLATLKSKGLSGDMISQIAAAGVSGGGLATASSLINATPAQLKQLNDLQTQLKGVADAAGDTTAKAMYGAGVDAAQGLVDGLKDKQSDIEDQMRIIAQSLIDLIQTKLGIASPSKVMHQMGVFTGMGLENGIESRVAGVQNSMRRLVGNTGIKGAAPTLGGTRVSTATMDTNSNVGTSVTHIGEIHLHLPEGSGMNLGTKGDRRNVARALVDEMKEAIRDSDRKRK